MSAQSIHIGWSVAAGAYNGTRFVVRPFTVGTFHREDAERYAREAVEQDYPPSAGWVVVVSAKAIMLPVGKMDEQTEGQ